MRSGQKAGGATVATPRFLAVGGLDLLILDTKNQLWRWRPADAAGAGTLVRVTVDGASVVGRRHHRDQHVPAGQVAQPLQPVRHRSVREADPLLLGIGRRWRLPAQVERLAGHGQGRERDRVDLCRWRHLRRRWWRARAIRRRQERRLGRRRHRRTRCCAPPRRTRWSRPRATAEPARSTPSTTPTSGSSPSTSSTARTARSTGSPAASRTGRICERWRRRARGRHRPSDAPLDVPRRAVPDAS